MIKVLIITASIAIVSGATSIFPIRKDDHVVEGCRFENELWGSEDGTKFYFCIPGTNTAIEQECPENTFFVKNKTASGCLPLTKVDSNCVYKSTVGPCTGENLKQPQPSLTPTQYYLCTAGNAVPLLLSCPEGKAFVKQDGYLGCFDWELWRTIRQCVNEN